MEILLFSLALFNQQWYMRTWCSGITSISHTEGLGSNPSMSIFEAATLTLSPSLALIFTSDFTPKTDFVLSVQPREKEERFGLSHDCVLGFRAV
eukprot:3744580-Amphidinium_carterae.3